MCLFFCLYENYKQAIDIDLNFLKITETKKQAHLSVSRKCSDTFRILYVNGIGKNNTNVHFIMKYSEKLANRTEEQGRASVF